MKTVHALLATTLLWCMGTASVGQTIMTDKDDYEPGETVTFNGDGFEAGETVDLRAVGNTNMTQIQHQVSADEMGAIAGSFLLPLMYEEVYELTATGQSSGIVAQTSFLDSFQLSRFDPNSANATLSCSSQRVFTVRARTQSNQSVQGAVINWTSADGTMSVGTSITDSNGRASSVHMAGSVHNTMYAVTASTPGQSGPASHHNESWTITTNCPIITVPPAITCPADIVADNAPGQAGANVTLGGASATGTPAPAVSYSPSSGFFALGTTAVTATATNSAGSDQCSFDVTVNDVEDPVISGMPANQTFYTGAGASTCDAVATWSAPTATDNSGSASLSSSHASGSSFNVGTTTVTYTAMDAAGNSVSASFDVTVIDNTNPVISGLPSDISMGTGPGNPNPSVAVNWTAPTASDNCGNTTLSSTHNPGDVFAIGTHTVTYTAGDDAGNQSSGSFDVTVYDNTPPVISGLSSGLNNTVCEVVDLGTPTVSDNYDPNPTVSNNAPSTFPIGMTTVVWTATDGSGNSSTFAQTVTVGYGTLEGFLPPMSMDGSAVKIKKGRTVPIKFRLTGCPGTSNVVANIYYQLVNDNNIPLEDPLEAVGTSAADIGNLFRYSASDDQYIFNLSTSSSQWTVNKKYRIMATLADGQVISGYISVVK